MICEKGRTSRTGLLHEVAIKLETTVNDVLSALHVLTGCDTTNKICSKSAALKTAEAGIKHLGKHLLM